MATKADFTPEEWEQLHKGVTGAGMLVSLSDRDFSDSFGESTAMAKYLAGQATAGSTQLVREIAGVHGTGFGFTALTREGPRRDDGRARRRRSPSSRQRRPTRSTPIARSSWASPTRSPGRRAAATPVETAMIERAGPALGAG